MAWEVKVSEALHVSSSFIFPQAQSWPGPYCFNLVNDESRVGERCLCLPLTLCNFAYQSWVLGTKDRCKEHENFAPRLHSAPLFLSPAPRCHSPSFQELHVGQWACPHRVECAQGAKDSMLCSDLKSGDKYVLIWKLVDVRPWPGKAGPLLFIFHSDVLLLGTQGGHFQC